MAETPTITSDPPNLVAQSGGDAVTTESLLLHRLRQRAMWAVPIALLASYLLTWAILLVPDPNRLIIQSDFVSTLTGARIISSGDGQDLYSVSAQLAAQKAIRTPFMGDEGNQLLPYIHPPFEALLIAPLSGFTYWVPYFLWVGLLALAFYYALRLLQGTLPLPDVGRANAAIVLALISYGPVFRAFRLGQNSPLVLLGLCGVYAAARRRSDGLAGVLLLLVALKPQVLPLVLLALLVQGRWRAVAWFCGLFGLACIGIMPVLGIQWPLQYVNVVIGAANWSDAGLINPAVMHNWRGLSTDLVGWFAPSLVTPLYVLVSIATLGLLAGVWLRVRHALWVRQESAFAAANVHEAKAQLLPVFDIIWALVGLAAVLLSPHLFPHDLTLLIFPAWIISAYLVNGYPLAVRGVWWLVLLVAHYLLLSVGSSVVGDQIVVPLSIGIIALAGVWLAKGTLYAASRRLPLASGS